MTRMRSWSHGLALGVALIALAACGDPASITRTPDAVQLAKSATGIKVKPVACATSGRKRAHAIIGPAGGSIALGNTVLAVPAGAVAAPQRFDVHLPPSDHLAIEVTAKGFASFRFLTPVSVSVDYSRCGSADLAKRSVAMWHVDETTGALLERMHSVVDAERRTITFATPHLSVYVMAEASTDAEAVQ